MKTWSAMFQEYLDEDFPRELYLELFKFRIDPWIRKLNRAIDFYKKSAPDCPERFFAIWRGNMEKLERSKARYGRFIEPGRYQEE